MIGDADSIIRLVDGPRQRRMVLRCFPSHRVDVLEGDKGLQRPVHAAAAQSELLRGTPAGTGMLRDRLVVAAILAGYDAVSEGPALAFAPPHYLN